MDRCYREELACAEESYDFISFQSRSWEFGVRAFGGEEVGVVAAELEAGVDEVELGEAFFHALDDLGGGDAGKFGQEPGAEFVVDGPAIVGVDERVVPELGALVEIGNAGAGVLEQGLCKGIDAAGQADGFDEGFELGEEGLVGEEAVDEVIDGVLVRLVVGDPGGLLLGLAHGLLHVGFGAVGRDGPGADEGLVEEVFGVGVWVGAGEVVAVGAGPSVDGLGEGFGNLGEHSEPGADIVGALGVMGGKGGHGGGVGGLHALVVGVEVGDGDAVFAGIGTDFVEAGEAVEAVEGGVLDALGHDGRGELLEAEDELGLERAGDLEGEHVLEEVEESGVDLGTVIARALDGAVDDCAVFAGDFGRAGRHAERGLPTGEDVGAVDGEAGGEFSDGEPDVGAGGVALVAVGLADIDEDAGEAIDVGAEGLLGDINLLVVRDGREGGGLRGEAGVDIGELLQAARDDEEAVGLVEEVVTAGAFDGPLLTEKLTGGEDLFAQDPGVGRGLAQAVEVLLGVAEAVGVIDADAVDDALGEPVEDERVGFGEDVLALHAKADEVVDVEEAAVAELLVGGLPPGEAIVLLVKEVVEEVEVLVEVGDGLVDGLADRVVLGAEALEHGGEDELVAVTGEDGGAILKGRRGQAKEGRGDEREGVRRVERGGTDQDGGDGSRRDGEGLAGGSDEEVVAAALERNAA